MLDALLSDDRPRSRSLAALVLGVLVLRSVNGKLMGYYLLLAIAVALFLLMLRFMNSPFGRVLQAIRENEFRARAIGYKPVLYRTAVFCLGSAIAAFAGGLYALWVGYTGPGMAGFFADGIAGTLRRRAAVRRATAAASAQQAPA